MSSLRLNPSPENLRIRELYGVTLIDPRPRKKARPLPCYNEVLKPPVLETIRSRHHPEAPELFCGDKEFRIYNTPPQKRSGIAFIDVYYRVDGTRGRFRHTFFVLEEGNGLLLWTGVRSHAIR